jgi:aldose 1-epimerase
LEVGDDVTLSVEPFGSLPNGSPVDLYTLSNQGGVELRAITYGAIMTMLRTPDRRGDAASIVLGHDRLTPYLRNRAYLGAVIGRFANRIARGRFGLDGRTHQLTCNDGAHHLHGGTTGFDQQLWSSAVRRPPHSVGVLFSRTRLHGEEGYPGRLDTTVTRWRFGCN